MSGTIPICAISLEITAPESVKATHNRHLPCKLLRTVLSYRQALIRSDFFTNMEDNALARAVRSVFLPSGVRV